MKSHLPTSNAAWSKLVKSNVNGLETISINRFVARYRLAKSFKSMKFEGYKDVTVSAYNTIFQLFLAYSALDILFKGIKQNKQISKYNKSIYSIKIKDEQLAKRLKLNTTFMDMLINNTTDDSTKEELVKFHKEPLRTNMMGIARGCRHLTAHGEMSAAGSTALNKKNAADLKLLSDLVLVAADNAFTEFVESFNKSSKDY
jgi:aromatic ring-cleaving dioxygenase